MARPRVEINESSYVGKFASRLKSLRERAKLTVEELSVKSGIPLKTLYKWESASCAPAIDRFPDLALALGVKTRSLLPED